MPAKPKALIFKKSIALATLGIFLCSDVSFALRPAAFDDRPSSQPDASSPQSFKDSYPSEEDMPGGTLLRFIRPNDEHIIVRTYSPGLFDYFQLDGAVSFRMGRKGSFHRIEMPPICQKALGLINNTTKDTVVRFRYRTYPQDGHTVTMVYTEPVIFIHDFEPGRIIVDVGNIRHILTERPDGDVSDRIETLPSGSFSAGLEEVEGADMGDIARTTAREATELAPAGVAAHNSPLRPIMSERRARDLLESTLGFVASAIENMPGRSGAGFAYDILDAHQALIGVQRRILPLDQARKRLLRLRLDPDMVEVWLRKANEVIAMAREPFDETPAEGESSPAYDALVAASAARGMRGTRDPEKVAAPSRDDLIAAAIAKGITAIRDFLERLNREILESRESLARTRYENIVMLYGEWRFRTWDPLIKALDEQGVKVDPFVVKEANRIFDGIHKTAKQMPAVAKTRREQTQRHIWSGRSTYKYEEYAAAEAQKIERVNEEILRGLTNLFGELSKLISSIIADIDRAGTESALSAITISARGVAETKSANQVLAMRGLSDEMREALADMEQAVKMSNMPSRITHVRFHYARWHQLWEQAFPHVKGGQVKIKPPTHPKKILALDKTEELSVMDLQALQTSFMGLLAAMRQTHAALLQKIKIEEQRADAARAQPLRSMGSLSNSAALLGAI
ncbi:MAG: hypothetical protein HY589_04920 [Candidatus Omnitrophica bacterium]|nr:hypothetical protein [Candidatus Omnitrophota bacterium]